jgi:hypothetical protein
MNGPSEVYDEVYDMELSIFLDTTLLVPSGLPSKGGQARIDLIL